MSDLPPNEEPPPYPGTGKEGAPPYSAGQPGYPTGQPGYPTGQPGGYPTGQPGGYQSGAAQPPPCYPQPGYQQGGYPVGTQPIVGGTVTVVQAMFRDLPVQTQCPNCHNHVTTNVTYNAGSMAWLMCFIFFLLGMWCCCCIPFCINSLQDADHSCPSCRHRIAHYSPL